jgi:hypothetical protein
MRLPANGTYQLFARGVGGSARDQVFGVECVLKRLSLFRTPSSLLPARPPPPLHYLSMFAFLWTKNTNTHTHTSQQGGTTAIW